MMNGIPGSMAQNSSMSEADLIARAQQGDEGAMAALYARHAPGLYRLAYGLLRVREDAEEVVQDALAYALRRLNRYDPAKAAFKSWLHTITVSRCRNKRRRRWLPTVRLGAWLARGGDARAPGGEPERTLLVNEQARQVWEAVGRLSPAVREVVVLRYWGGHTVPEIARIVGCPTATAQSRLRLAHQQLERHLRVTLAPPGGVEETECTNTSLRSS
jgi:RNA polymerase sigma-70 factor (ECF subfamily)